MTSPLLVCQHPRLVGQAAALGAFKVEGPRAALSGDGSWLFELLCGARQLASGSVALCGFEVEGAVRRGEVGLMLADVELPLSWATRDVLAHSARLLGHSPRSATQLAAQAAEESDLSGVLSKRVADLDAAQRRVLQIALAMVGNPPVLALEQPLAGLEPSERERTIRTLKVVLEGRAAIISAPAMATDPEGDSLLDMMDEVLVMGALGLVARGTFAQLARSTDSYQVVVSRHCDAFCERLVEMGYTARVMTVGDLSVLSVTDTSARGTAALLGAAHDVDAPVRQLAPIRSGLAAP